MNSLCELLVLKQMTLATSEKPVTRTPWFLLLQGLTRATVAVYQSSTTVLFTLYRSYHLAACRYETAGDLRARASSSDSLPPTASYRI